MDVTPMLHDADHSISLISRLPMCAGLPVCKSTRVVSLCAGKGLRDRFKLHLSRQEGTACIQKMWFDSQGMYPYLERILLVSYAP